MTNHIIWNIFEISNMYEQVFKLHAKLLKALAHPKRLEIIQLLRDQELSVTDIQTMLDLPQANLSQHLMILRDAGVTNTRKEGKNIYYSIAHSNFIKASDLMREILVKQYKDSTFSRELSIEMTSLVPLTHDPVCGMRLSPKTASYAYTFKKTIYYFCAHGCMKEFKTRPESFIEQHYARA
ncbi:metalloregulator ArsR/SmtB family transcription factor [Candidatus Roizmanbacteria bacterium]|nr:metalloregulator ArsR/SmtB family transcription factor [Candidatus Roizmanbacteria bacterium]